MFLIITKGQKIDVTKGRNLPGIAIGLDWQSDDPAIDINASAFLLDANGVCTRDEDMVFYNQPISRNESVIHSENVYGYRETIQMVHSVVPKDVAKVAITLTIHDGENNGQSFAKVRDSVCKLYNPQDGNEIARFHFGQDLTNETAIVVGEIYLHNGEWKFNAVGSGFIGGLTALVRNFGLHVSEEVTQEVAAAAVQEPIKQFNVELKKKESISIQKSTKVTATLEWQTENDLDLYCFYITKNSVEGKVYYNELGSASKMPYIQLDGDAKGNGKETIVIHRPEELNYVLFAAYSALSNGTGSFKSMNVRAVVDNHLGQAVATPLHEKNDFAYWVAIAHIDFTDTLQMKVSHVEKYSNDHMEESPLLYPDGSFQMDVGPIEFKDDDFDSFI
ncbi:TerD family protein [Paenibacillus alba]|uniref:TerD family protein n=1 Tax=Paenibacillus alba TaxID=1197127 RepID=A0ABU6GC50_9BACL|nr:TerD family protein [Paenibacillus alba]MEC0231771.1 TerD family protein [Paenibacillus alba]